MLDSIWKAFVQKVKQYMKADKLHAKIKLIKAGVEDFILTIKDVTGCKPFQS